MSIIATRNYKESFVRDSRFNNIICSAGLGHRSSTVVQLSVSQSNPPDALGSIQNDKMLGISLPLPCIWHSIHFTHFNEDTILQVGFNLDHFERSDQFLKH